MAGRSIGRSVSQSVGRSVGWSVGRSVGRSVSQSINQSGQLLSSAIIADYDTADNLIQDVASIYQNIFLKIFN